jgi:hypothetical protein
MLEYPLLSTFLGSTISRMLGTDCCHLEIVLTSVKEDEKKIMMKGKGVKKGKGKRLEYFSEELS